MNLDANLLYEEYTCQPECDGSGHEALWRYIEPRARVIQDELVIIEDDLVDPYDAVGLLIRDVREGVLKLGPTVEHPYWTPAQQRGYRAWHDVEGHAVHVKGFDRYGEVEVLRQHVRAIKSAQCRLTEAERESACCAVFNEILCRVACGIVGQPDTPHRPIHLGEYGRRILDALTTI